MDNLYLVQGYMLISGRTPEGRPGPQWWAGNVRAAALRLDADLFEKLPTYRGLHRFTEPDPGQVAARLTGTFDQWHPRTLALGLYAPAELRDAGSVVNEALPAGLRRGDIVSLARPFAGAVTFQAAGGAVLPAGLFRRFGHNGRAFQIVGDVAAYPQPFRASYAHLACEQFDVLKGAPADAYVVLDGINAVDRTPIAFDLFQVQFDPFDSISLIDSGVGSLAFAADVIADPLNMTDGAGIARIRRGVANG